MKQQYNFDLTNLIKNKFLLVLIIFCCASLSFSQSISPTNGGTRCFSCAPTGWAIITGTPDISDRFRAANTGIGGGNATWVNTPLPLPPNNHNAWISIRDLGTVGPEEAVGTTITGLTVGRNYELIVYTMSVLSNQDGGGAPAVADPAWKYAGTFIDQLRYRLNGGAILTQNNISQNVWGGTRLPFTATSTSSTFELLPGNNATVTASPAGSNGIETVQVAITLNAINTVPVANSNSVTTSFNTPAVFNVVDNDIDFDIPGGTNPIYSGINPATVDLNPALAGIQNSFTSANGVWTVNTSGVVTFTPNNGFTGTETIPYTVRDGFTIDGLNGASTSNSANLSVTIPPQANLNIVKSVDNSSPAFGSNIVFTLIVNNAGPNTAPAVTVNDLLPSGFTFVSSNGGVAYNSNTGVWTVGSLNNGASASLQIVATVAGSGNYTNTATVNSTAADANGSDNTSFVTVTPVCNATIAPTLIKN